MVKKPKVEKNISIEAFAKIINCFDVEPVQVKNDFKHLSRMQTRIIYLTNKSMCKCLLK